LQTDGGGREFLEAVQTDINAFVPGLLLHGRGG